LIAEDDSVSRKALELTLKKWGYDVVAAKDGDVAWEILQGEDAPQLAILDWMMPGMDGAAICQKVRERTEQLYTYILLLTAKSEKQDIVAGLDAGADDYLTKPFDLHELRVRLRAGERILDLEDKLIAARESLRYQATHDLLTELWNRGTIFEMLERELERAQRANGKLGVILGDIDHFKQINDTYGHAAGDAVLKEVAQRMVRMMRPYDAIGRYGGEEFMMVLPECDQRRTMDIAERLRESVSKALIVTPDGEIPVTMSLGVAAYPEMTIAKADMIVRAADAALYRAKQSGRNRVEN
jgi:diguanylate cyclase (GGDEF)-like protein